MNWYFSSRSGGEIEGLGNGGLEMFKGDRLKALAREICQNSLDARNDKSKPVRVEFKIQDVKSSEFPGLMELEHVINKCVDFWKDDANRKTQVFLERALMALSSSSIRVMRISDYNTSGLVGAYEFDNYKTPWTGLVKSSAVSVKSNSSAAGSYGIGKNAPFVNSDLQTVFYRTYDIEGKRANLGVARLMSFKDESYDDGDTVRRSVGYFGDDQGNPVCQIEKLDNLHQRTEYGTDLFVPAFQYDDNWIDRMVGEILDNFLMSIYYENLEVTIGSVEINKSELGHLFGRFGKYAKDAYQFYKVLRSNEDELADAKTSFHGMGNLRIRLLYKSDQNQKILVVRNSGMKIAEIPKLPKIISFSGILELEGDDLNEYFREMETPQHNKWEPGRHTNPEEAKIYLEELEKWVRNIIDEKVNQSIGEEMDLDTFEYFNGKDGDDTEKDGESMKDSVVEADFQFQKKRSKSYSSSGKNGSNRERGFVDDDGEEIGYRHRSGGGSRTTKGRKAIVNPLGPDVVTTGRKKVALKARVIKETKLSDKIIISSSEGIRDAIIEIGTMGENGKSLPLFVESVSSDSINVYCKNGKIYVDEIAAGQKATMNIGLGIEHNFALGVTVYGNKQ